MKANTLSPRLLKRLITLCTVMFVTSGHAVDRVDNAEMEVFSPASATATSALEGCALEPDGPGTLIDISYYVPEHNLGEKMPMILHSHGWGGSKHNDPSAEIKENELFGSERGFLNQMVDNGYIVVSFSERGWGDSGGQVRGIDRSCETVDASAVLDWAVANLPVATEGGDPLVGTFGGSYGGGFQHMLIQEDSRIDGIVVLGSWNSLPYALTPNNVLKRSFASLLCGLGFSGATLDDVFYSGCVAALAPLTRTRDDIVALAPGELNLLLDPVLGGLSAIPGIGSSLPGSVGAENFIKMLERNGIDYFDGEPNYFAEYDRQDGPGGSARVEAQNGELINPKQPGIPAMYIQGNRDVLFNLNEAIRNLEYMKNTGSSELWFLTNQSGHMNPLANQVNSSTNCGEIDIWEAAESFFYDKLMSRVTNAAGSSTKAGGKPACRGCKVESKFSGDRAKKPACRGCRVESRGQVARAAAPALQLANIPRICVSLNEYEGVSLTNIPHPDFDSSYFPITANVQNEDNSAVQVAGIVENLPTALESILTPNALVPGTDEYLLQYSNKTLPTQEAKFFLLHTAVDGEVIAGVPVFTELEIKSLSQDLAEDVPLADQVLPTLADLLGTIGTTLGGIIPLPGLDSLVSQDAIAYVGVGVRRTSEDGTRQILLDGQAQPFSSKEFSEGIPDGAAPPELAGVGFKLQAGDEVGLMLFSEHPQYEFASTRLGTNAYTIKGALQLPIFTPGADEPITTYQGEITPKPCNTSDPVEFVYTLSTCLDDPLAAIVPSP